MFHLGFSLVHLGYSLIFAMVVAGFFWNDDAYFRWRITDNHIFQISEHDLKWHCEKCRIISLSEEQQNMSPQERQYWSIPPGPPVWELMSKREKLDYLASHECDPYELLCKRVRPPALFTSKSDIRKSPWLEQYCAIEMVLNVFPQEIDCTRHVQVSLVQGLTASFMSEAALLVSRKDFEEESSEPPNPDEE